MSFPAVLDTVILEWKSVLKEQEMNGGVGKIGATDKKARSKTSTTLRRFSRED